ncbi:MAG: 8-amino-7-oxononanoate synthase [Muribaculaceae bacterium]|nr:8-amino-7-oxononanoate synthase [Muribaculaceae bacterium]
MNIDATLYALQASGNMRTLPTDTRADARVDLSTNDYLGIGSDELLRQQFMEHATEAGYGMTASASRLLASHQNEFAALEGLLEDAYGRPALLFNSGYHANTGMISALAADKHTLVVADRLVHASIIDGIRLAGAPMERFCHNDYNHLQRILDTKGREYNSVLIVAESIYSMDGDRADIGALAEAKESHEGAMLYVDEAHAVGVAGPHGLGLSAGSGCAEKVDIIVGTMGKALAGMGAFGVMSGKLRRFMINKARSLIFSTAMPPICAAWNRFVFEKSLGMDSERAHLKKLSRKLYDVLGLSGDPSHIAPFIVGTPYGAVNLSKHLDANGFHVLPIRTPTVPPGTDRLRFSLSASLEPECLEPLRDLVK